MSCCVLGRGGMGIVYQARHVNSAGWWRSDDPQWRADSEDRSRFVAEARVVAGLQHPNIVQVHEVGEASGSTLPLAGIRRGRQPAQRLAGTPLPGAEAARLVATWPGPCTPPTSAVSCTGI